MKYPLIDTHCHFFDLEKSANLKTEIKEAENSDINYFFCSASYREAV